MPWELKIALAVTVAGFLVFMNFLMSNFVWHMKIQEALGSGWVVLIKDKDGDIMTTFAKLEIDPFTEERRLIAYRSHLHSIGRMILKQDGTVESHYAARQWKLLRDVNQPREATGPFPEQRLCAITPSCRN